MDDRRSKRWAPVTGLDKNVILFERLYFFDLAFSMDRSDMAKTVTALAELASTNGAAVGFNSSMGPHMFGESR